MPPSATPTSQHIYYQQAPLLLSNTIRTFDTSFHIIFRLDFSHNDAGRRILPFIIFVPTLPLPISTITLVIAKQIIRRLHALRFNDIISIQHDADQYITLETRKSMETGYELT